MFQNKIISYIIYFFGEGSVFPWYEIYLKQISRFSLSIEWYSFLMTCCYRSYTKILYQITNKHFDNAFHVFMNVTILMLKHLHLSSLWNQLQNWSNLLTDSNMTCSVHFVNNTVIKILVYVYLAQTKRCKYKRLLKYTSPVNPHVS